jgi:hypothetical protein
MRRRILVVLLATSAAHAADHRLLRRLGAVAVCAAAALDAGSTYRASHGPGHESSGLFAAPDGSVRWGRFAAVKLGSCGGAIFLSEWRRIPTPQTIAGMAGMAIPQFRAGAHNLALPAK